MGLSAVKEDDLYEAMDWLLERQAGVEQALAARHLGEGTLVLYDLTSTYFGAPGKAWRIQRVKIPAPARG